MACSGAFASAYVMANSLVRARPVASVAFVGNSMFYFNDFPRFFEEIGDGGVVQNSCLHGGASIGSLVIEGNSMYPQFETAGAILGLDDEWGTIYDYGACTVRQLLSGEEYQPDRDGYYSEASNDLNNANPCRADAAYMEYANAFFKESTAVREGWDYVLINDNSRSPARWSTREHSLETLREFYVPLLLETGSTPVFLWTHAYTFENTCETEYVENSNVVSMTGLEDIANFTSLTRVGYQAYVDLLNSYLPSSQAPRIAPVGLAFLVVHEENYELWKTLFHCDGLHASPSGSLLQGCIVYYTLFGKMPNKDLILREDISSLWSRARMMQHAWEPANQFPDQATAKYLYRVAERVMVEGHVPTSFIDYQNGEVASEA
ncbi:hypothetical protein ACHAW5_006384 [Stephanodiscus triporus]|uniref:Uncharacterized protein n=1 Tax=Stephanodiscus triporus TaxID=2934178 RepID=A0ABD3QT33_9STRA